jgi:hypothetical protein
MKKQTIGKIYTTLLTTLVISSVFGSITATETNLPEPDDMTMEEKIRNYDPTCQDMSEEELQRYIEDVRMPSPPDNTNNDTASQFIQDPISEEERPLIYEPPWSVYDIDHLEENWGIAESGWEGAVDQYQGWANVAAAAGPGLGEASMTVWTYHGLVFPAPVTSTYTITFEYTVQGWVQGGITWIDAVASSQVSLFFRVGSTEEEQEIFYEQTIPIIYQQYERYFEESRTVTIQKQLYEGNNYWIEGIAGIRGRALGALLDFGYSYNHLDDENTEGWGNGAVLNRITIDWPNHPPERPERPQGPSEGLVGQPYTYETITSDPDDLYDRLWYKWSWGDGSESNWLGPYPSGEVATASHIWTQAGTYEITVRAKDMEGDQSPVSPSKQITITAPNHPPNKPDTPSGPTQVESGESATYTTRTTDPDPGDQVMYQWDWGDETSDWEGPYDSGETVSFSHKWTSCILNGKSTKQFSVKVRAKDNHEEIGPWSEELIVTVIGDDEGATYIIIDSEALEYLTNNNLIQENININEQNNENNDTEGNEPFGPDN